jgi:hypothetical protein
LSLLERQFTENIWKNKNYHLNRNDSKMFISYNYDCKIMAILTMQQQYDTKSLKTGQSKILSGVLLNDMIKSISLILRTLSIKTILSYFIGALKSRFIDIQLSSEKYGANRLPNAHAIGLGI